MSFWSGPRSQPVPLARLLDELDELHDYARDLISGGRGAVPSETAIGRLLANQPSVPVEQVVHQVVLTLIALFAPTTPGSISSGLLSFARNPEQIRKFLENPGYSDGAADEIFRYNPSNQFTWRVATQATQVGDVHVEAGDVVVLFLGSANHDAAVFDRPHEFLIDRPNSGEHLTFGVGMHSCLGRRIAHCQVKWLITALFRQFSTIELTGQHVWNANLEFRSLRSLPIRFS
jgi:4-nitrotryptophan synthase